MVHKKRHKTRRRDGSAMILVVVVTVLLAVIGVMFVMVARVGEMESSAVTDNSDLDAAVDSVVARIHTVLIDDLFKGGETFGNGSPLYNHPTANPWLASLEPVQEPAGSGNYIWPDITNLNNGLDPLAWDRRPVIIRDNQPASAINPGSAADADGDGVADSIWIRMPNISTSRGRPVFAAVRIIDNCAMLNLNTANCFQINTVSGGAYDGWFYYNQITGNMTLYEERNTSVSADRVYYSNGGRYLSEINYRAFLRGSGTSIDNPYGILSAKKFSYLNASGGIISQLPVNDLHVVLMSIEDLYDTSAIGASYTLFDIGDELEMRNRYFLTSRVLARFEREDVSYNTYDFGRGNFGEEGGYPQLQTRRVPYQSGEMDEWKIRLNPDNFDDIEPTYHVGYYYDRRHISTFYSFDRSVQTAQYPQLVADFLQAMQAESFLTAQAAENAARIFWPAGYVGEDQDGNPVTSVAAVTTNIAVPQLDPSGQIVRDGEGNIVYNYNNVQARQRILHLLYAFRAYYLDQGNTVREAARRAAQIVANMIDYSDDDELTASGPFADAVYGAQINAEPTYLSKAIIDEMIREVSQAITGNEITVAAYSQLDFGLEAGDVIFGYERQPFITEVYSHFDEMLRAFAIELYNPYDEPISLDGWTFRFGAQDVPLNGAGYVVPARADGGRLTIWRSDDPSYNPVIHGRDQMHPSAIFLNIQSGRNIELYRPDPHTGGDFLMVDRMGENQLDLLFIDGIRSVRRDDTQWRFANADRSRSRTLFLPGDSTLGLENGGILPDARGYQLPVANDGKGISRLADFSRVAFIGNQKGGTSPRTVTQQIALAGDESGVRFDVETRQNLLDYICFLNRPEKGSLPGRININTAAKHVIAAAIPPQLVMAELEDTEHALYFAEQIIANRPYQRVSDLLAKIPAFQKYNNHSTVTVGDQNVRGDFEERDWILGRLANIFTVRSDTFTAYILVRLGQDGPQRRMIAIFDRSQCWTPDDRPRLVALHPVPDPR